MRYDSASRRSFLLTFQTVAIGCSWSGVVFLSRKPLSPKHRSTFLPLQHTATLIFSVDWGLGDYAFLNGRCNEHAIYQFKVKRVTDLDDGFRWSMVDAVNGNSLGYELNDTFRASSSNVAQIGAVTGGLNEVALSLQLLDAGNDDIRVVISKESEIFATSWRPTLIDGRSRTKVQGNVIDLAFEGRNRGWAAPSALRHRAGVERFTSGPNRMGSGNPRSLEQL